MFAVRTAAVLVLDLERDIDAQVHVLRQTVQAILTRGEGVGQRSVLAALSQLELAQRNGLTAIDAGDDGFQRIGAVSVSGNGVSGAVCVIWPVIWICHL